MSNLSIGIVGLPNVGKSTLFNALTKQQVPAENYPFCTIDPNVGVVAVPDPRLEELAKIVNPQKITPAVVEFVDIAGLVKGASQGEGLGNQFLANIREVDLIAHIIRFFPSEKVAHVEEKVEPTRDKQIVEMELMLKDLESVSKRLEKLEGEARASSKESEKRRELQFWQNVYKLLEEGKFFSTWDESKLSDEEKKWLLEVPLLSAKKVIYIANTGGSQSISEQEAAKTLELDLKKSDIIVMDILQESDLISMSDQERVEYMQNLGQSESGLDRLIKKGYDLLGLQTFFTAGEQEVRAWTIQKGTTAPDAAAVIHTDFETHFIAMDVVSYDDFISLNGWASAKEKGKVRLEGRDYVLQEGEVVLFKHNA